MNDKDRKRITACCEEIASCINMKILWPQLLENRIFNIDDCNIPAWSENLNSLETRREIILTIKTRGPHAFKNFLLSLRQSGYDILANNLNESNNNSNNQLVKEIIPDLNKMQLRHNSENNDEENEDDDDDDDEKEEEDEEKNDEAASFNRFITEPTPLQIAVKKSKSYRDGPVTRKTDIEKYIMRSKPRGFVLIVCIIDYIVLSRRDGAQHDENNLKKMFEDMGFEVTVTANNLTGAEIRNVTKEFATRKDFRKVDSCFVIFSCHGFEAGNNWDAEIAGVDYPKKSTSEKLYCSEIIGFFSSENCKNLIGKPKVFIFQMCRGEKPQYAVSRHVADGFVTVEPIFETDLQSQFHRNYENTLIAHATIPGHYSYRDIINGSWCIQVLCEVFMREAHRRHLIDLFHIIDHRLGQLRRKIVECQTLTVTNMGFNKHCYLNPGYFGENQ